MGKDDDNKENQLEINQPLLPKNKSNFICSNESSNSSSPTSELSSSSAALLRVSPSTNAITSTANPCELPSSSSSSSTIAIDRPPVSSCSTAKPTTSVSSDCSNNLLAIVSNANPCKSQSAARIANDLIDQSSVGSPTLDNEIADSQQALFAPDNSNKLNFYKRWFFTRQHSSNDSSRSNSIDSNSDFGSSMANSNRKRKMINLSQYNSYMRDERNGKSKHKKREAQHSSRTSQSSTSNHTNQNVTSTSTNLNNNNTTLTTTSSTLHATNVDLPTLSLPGPSGLHCSSGCCSSDGGCASTSPSASTNLSRSSSSERFSFDSDDEITQFTQSALSSSRKHLAQQCQSNSIALIDAQTPLILDNCSSAVICNASSSIDSNAQQVLNAQALCSAPIPSEPSADEQLTVSSCDSRCKKSILLPQLHQDCKRKPTTNHLQVQREGKSEPMAHSVSQLSVASSLFTDPLLPICKICHLNGKEGDPLISPCKCAGTMQFIHCGCLMRWLEISSKKTRKPLSCELCQYQYHWHKKFKVDHLQFPYCSRKDKLLHLLFFISLCIMIACAVVIVLCFKRDRLNQINGHPRTELSDSELSTLICGVLFFLSFFTAMYVQVKARNTLYRLIVKFIYLNQQWYIDEYEKKDNGSPVEV